MLDHVSLRSRNLARRIHQPLSRTFWEAFEANTNSDWLPKQKFGYFLQFFGENDNECASE